MSLITEAVADEPTLILTPARKVFLNKQLTLWCIVDADDFEWVGKDRWYWGSGGNRYAYKRYVRHHRGKERRTIYLHREVLKRSDPHSEIFMCWRHADHINGQTLDNRRCNLRWATPSQNQKNRIMRGQVPKITWIWKNLCLDAEKVNADIPW